MKKIYLIAFIILSINFSFAAEEMVILEPTQVYSLNTPQPINEVLSSINKNEENEQGFSDLYETEDDVTTNKFEKKFYNFVNDKVVNNRFSLFSTSLGREISDTLP